MLDAATTRTTARRDARAGAAAPPLGRRLRRHLLPRRVRRPRPHASTTSGPSPRSRCPTTCRSRSTCRRSGSSPPPSSTSAPTSRSSATSRRSSGARSCGCSSCPSRAAAPTWPACLTRADRDGDVFVLNGSKIWSSAAFASDYAMCLARTNWDVPKHRGPHDVHRQDPPAGHPGGADPPGRRLDGVLPGVLRRRRHPGRRRGRRRRRRLDGRLPGCWSTSATRSAAARPTRAAARPATTPPAATTPSSSWCAASGQSRRRRTPASSSPRRTSARWSGGQLIGRVTQGVSTGAMAPPAGSLLKLFSATNVMRRYEIGLELAGEAAAAWPAGDGAGRPPASSELTLVAAGPVARRRQQRDPAQHHQRAPPRHAARVRRRPRGAVPRGPARRLLRRD